MTTKFIILALAVCKAIAVSNTVCTPSDLNKVKCDPDNSHQYVVCANTGVAAVDLGPSTVCTGGAVFTVDGTVSTAAIAFMAVSATATDGSASNTASVSGAMTSASTTFMTSTMSAASDSYSSANTDNSTPATTTIGSLNPSYVPPSVALPIPIPSSHTAYDANHTVVRDYTHGSTIVRGLENTYNCSTFFDTKVWLYQEVCVAGKDDLYFAVCKPDMTNVWELPYNAQCIAENNTIVNRYTGELVPQ